MKLKGAKLVAKLTQEKWQEYGDKTGLKYLQLY